MWPPLLLRLGDPAPPVALRALEVLWELSDVCGDFVRRRVVKGVWPVIAQSLERLAGVSRGSEETYQFSMNCKLQRKMLETVGILSVRLQVGGATLSSPIRHLRGCPYN